jgi:GTPase SAR1 family protein
MAVAIQDIVGSIKRKYLNVRADRLKQRSWNLKGIAELELTEGKCSGTELEESVSKGNASTCTSIDLKYTQIFRREPQYLTAKHNTKFLVLGETGIGKTMLCASIAEDWANGKLFQQFLFVLLLPLYQRNIAKVNSLPELLDKLGLLNKGDSQSLISYLMNADNQILVLADEYYESKHYSSDSFLYRLLWDNPFPNLSITVMITARPGSFPLHMIQHIDRLINVKGFDKYTIVNCVHSEFRGDVERIRYLLRQMEDNVLIESMCRVPLNLALISNLSRSHKGPLPDTMTELYKRICWSVAQVSIRDCDNMYKNVLLYLSSYSDLPMELQHSWWLLCEVAYRIIERYVAEEHKFTSRLEVVSTKLDSISYFGLLKFAPTKENDASTMQICFLHPFIEEYLAALHLARQKKEAQLDFIRLCTEKNMCQHLAHFWRFYLGTVMNESLHENVIPVQAAIQMLSNWHSLEKSERLLCYYSLEAKNKLVSNEIVKILSTTDTRSGAISVNFARPCNSQDCIAMTHVIESIDKKCSIEISFRGCNLKATDILRLTAALKSVSSRVQIQGLDLSDINLEDSDSVIADFFNGTAAALFSLQKLFLRNCGIGTMSIDTIVGTLAQSSSKTLIQLDLSLNKFSMSNLRTLQNHIKSCESLVNLEILFLKGSLSKDVDMDFFACFINTLTARCICLRRLDLSSNDLGIPGNPALSSIISQLTNLRSDFDLSLNPEYMIEVDNSFICTMEEAIRNKGIIDHTISHGIIVGPGRSGKNTLMNRLMGKRPNPDSASPSTGVMEAVVKVEVQKMCTVATAVSDLKWQRLEYDEEALELIMTTAKHHSASQPMLKPISKYIIQEQQIQSILTRNLPPETALEIATEKVSNPKRQKAPKVKIAKFFSRLSKPLSKFISKQSSKTVALENTRRELNIENSTSTCIVPETKDVVVHSSELESVDILKRAVKLRRMDALREHLESSWSLYLTNTGGQIEFQEHLSLLACGPSIFFVTFPLHHDLNQPYEVRYEESDGQIRAYQSTATLLEELLQTLATIDALDYASEYKSNVESIKPKVFFIGTHKDKLELKTTAEKTIIEMDQVLQTFVRQTSLFRQGSIQFAQQKPTQKLMFAVNNLSTDDSEFQKIRSTVQQTVERREDFTVKCPSSWLVFSLILRAKHKSNQVLGFEECVSIARECGISDRGELRQALTFIHLRLGLVRYFNVEGLNELIIIDPQILFDRITDLLKKTFTPSHAEVNQIEDFFQKGILPIEVVESIAKKCDSDVKIPFPWLTKLLNYLRIAALFRDQDGDKYFFPAALCHAPKPISTLSFQINSITHLLIGFESGFCPRGIPGALIKILMTNEMKSEFPWELRPKKIFRNQVSFGIEAYGDVTLKFFPTHIEISIDTDDDITNDELNTSCIEACTQIKQCMKVVSSQFSNCPYFLSFYCTLEECEAHPHPAKIEWRGSNPSRLKCKIMDKRSRLPTGYYRYFSRDVPYLDREIDFCHSEVPKHLGHIADSMAEWEGPIADELGLTEADVASIKTKHPANLKLQSYVCMVLLVNKFICMGFGGSAVNYQFSDG